MSDIRIELENVIAEGVSFETYMAEYADQHAEWVEGMLRGFSLDTPLLWKIRLPTIDEIRALVDAMLQEKP